MTEAVIGDGDATTIRQNNCAIREIALRFPEVCSAEAEFIASVLDTPVERRQHLKDGCRACEYGATERTAVHALTRAPASAPETTT